jgi:hypothetical protein
MLMRKINPLSQNASLINVAYYAESVRELMITGKQRQAKQSRFAENVMTYIMRLKSDHSVATRYPYMHYFSISMEVQKMNEIDKPLIKKCQKCQSSVFPVLDYVFEHIQYHPMLLCSECYKKVDREGSL